MRQPNSTNADGLFVLAPTPTPYFDHGFTRLAKAWPAQAVSVFYTHARTVWKDDTQQAFRTSAVVQVDADWEPGFSARLRDWRTGGKVLRQLTQCRPAVVLLLGYQDPSRWRVMAWCRRNGVPVLAWSDVNAAGMKPGTGVRGWLKKRYLAWVDRQVSAWLVCGRRGVEYLSYFGVERRRMFYSPCEPDYGAIESTTPERASEVARSFGLVEGRRRVVCSGRFVRTKRFDLAIRAFVEVAGTRPDWDLVILGDGELAGELKSLVPSDLIHRVTWTGFVRESDVVWALYKSCDVLLHVPDHEPWGLVVNEAVCLGLAVVSTDVVGASAELVRDGVNGRVVPAGDLNAVVRALLEVTSEPALQNYQAQARPMLRAWREKADPITGLRAALKFAGVDGF